MRIVSYNILDGGEGRADPLAEVIEAQRPDVVALVEAEFPPVVKRIAKRLGMDYIVGTAGDRASALLSRWVIQNSINHAAVIPGFKKSFLEATVLDPAGVAWPISVVHLPAGAKNEDEHERIRHLAVLLDRLKSHRLGRRPHIVCGDFNSNAPYQKIDPARCKLKTQEAWHANGGNLPRLVVEAMLAAGYIDTYHQLHDESIDMLGSFTTQHPGQRVDYIFAHGLQPSQIHDAWLERDRLAKYASDHFPVGAELVAL